MSSWEYTETELWRHGQDGASLFHVFGLIAVGQTVLAFSEARSGEAGDAGCTHDLWMRKSTDGGRSGVFDQADTDELRKKLKENGCIGCV